MFEINDCEKIINCPWCGSENLPKQLKRYKSLLEDSLDCKRMLLQPPADLLRQFGELLERTWKTKKQLEESISSSEIDVIHMKVKSLGGYGGKLSGAGSGGFFYEIIPRATHAAVLDAFGPSKVLRVAYEPLGSRLLSELF